MFRFEHTYLLWALLLVPIIILFYIFQIRKKNKDLTVFAEKKLLPFIIPTLSRTKPFLKMVLICISIALVIIAIANPQIGSKLEDVKREGIDVMICLDVSNSMKAADLQPNRLEHAKQSINKLIDNLKDDRIGIIVFGGEAYVQLPITTDYSAAKLFLSQIDNGIVPVQGTAIGNAIDLAVNSFDKKSPTKKSIIIISDGENHEDDAVKAAEKALELGITTNTIGLGSPNGTPIPEYVGGRNVGFKKDNEGNVVITKLNEQMLQEIALAGKGAYAKDNNSSSALSAIYKQLNSMDKVQFGSKSYTDFESRFQYFIAAAILLLIAELIITNKRSKWWDDMNLFGENKKVNP
jgi:Ca-activated chloride channel family protein